MRNFFECHKWILKTVFVNFTVKFETFSVDFGEYVAKWPISFFMKNGRGLGVRSETNSQSIRMEHLHFATMLKDTPELAL
jgi:hypothetical protein